ncbi:5'-nucleotidase C-terminal domain-containing protein [Comamonas sp. JC664]|uniref:bifunctional metallophosphatase/5'-nucleotidase n=1 Tax=Comamonas sp. JC664 TaxID=2801917 RepID=UPI00174BDFC4|nr:5'-nucleotidase C-terminal domain-containing protein [Comamonas sp. JC664]MBL0695536.1 5'-nucleotidase C-terminal domain-containing protein [Comamonas sp. JC664]GHG62109.1 multifunctional 2',3'-cyclic-nucleotide 2'-phosphodiesterase/5'-nucleotidase/3'-nucleotidase [Comamonas sp. KCTC 72670]
MRTSRRIFVLALACGVAACAGTSPRPVPPPAEPVRITLVGINDFHGQVEPHRTPLKDGQVLEEGGAATLSAYVARLRADNPDGVVLVDAGDIFQGTLPSNLTEGAVVIDVYNHLGVAAAAIGNHEFDYGPEGPGSMALRPGEDGLGALKARIRQARFPLLSANLRDAATGKAPAWTGNDGTLLMTVKGVKVGVLGLTTESTPNVTNPANVSSLRFLPLAPSALEASRSLRAKGAEVVVAVAHAGGKCTDLRNPRDTLSCARGDAEILDMLDALPAGTVDAVVAGHTHQTMGHFFGGVPVIETTGQARSLGVVELYVDPERRRVIPERTRIQAAIPLCAQVDAVSGTCDGRRLREQPEVRLEPASFLGAQVTPDAQVAPLLDAALALAREAQHRQVGLVAPVPMARGYTAEGVLGNLVADVLRASARADVGVMNPGGIRADLPAGALTFGQVFEALPFDNRLAVITLTGAELTRLLALAHANDRGSVFAVSGLELTLNTCPGPERLRSVTLTGGKPLAPERLYRVALPDFLARGGDGLGPVTGGLPPERVDLAPVHGLDLREALLAYGKARGGMLEAPALGRVRYTGVAECPQKER